MKRKEQNNLEMSSIPRKLSWNNTRYVYTRTRDNSNRKKIGIPVVRLARLVARVLF